jgi:hypothetical protein
MVRYRPAIKIVLRILECIATRQPSGRALKTHIIQCANLKTTSAEKYLEMLKEAGYILGSRTWIAENPSRYQYLHDESVEILLVGYKSRFSVKQVRDPSLRVERTGGNAWSSYMN